MLVVGQLAAAAPLAAALCSVPGSHANLQFALADPNCATIELAAQTYADSLRVTRAVAIAGAPAGGSILEGHLSASGASAVVALSDLVVQNGCPGDALRAEGGARVAATGVEVVRSALLPCPPDSLFVDGFESGATGSWSATVG